MERFSALIGFVLILVLAWALSNNKRAIQWKTVFWGLVLQILIAIFVLKGEPIARLFGAPAGRTVAALSFIAAAIIVTQIAKRVGPAARR
ncbi:MAG TPA: Na+ dependent nucleoside transporter N-terminal domain-containing protein, partial [Thermoanaerobaculia bacterium]|nr:Na+ dependent nucleoside transporter N-terminal domain-containing protein [Thermoanaerobaculia bacterium]